MKINLTKEEFENRATAYALGALGLHEARAFEDMLSSLSKEELEELKEINDIAALLAFDSISVEPPPSVKEKLFERINEENKISADPRMFIVRSNEGKWIEIGAGILVKQLFADPFKKTTTTLLQMKPGASLPEHKHTGIEECYLLEGDITMDGEHYTKGDYLCAFPDTIHQPLSTTGGALLLLIVPADYEAVHP